MDRVELFKKTDKAIIDCGVKEIGGEKGYSVDVDTFSEISKELHFHDGDASFDQLIDIVCLMEAFAGKSYERREYLEPVKLVEIDGELNLFMLDGVFKESYGENDVERALSALSVTMMRYPFSKWIEGTAEMFGVDVRDEFLENVDEELFERFYGGVEPSKVDEEDVPNCLLGDSMTVVEIGLEGCSPCKVVESAFEELEGEMGCVGVFDQRYARG